MTDPITLDQLEVFRSISETGSFSAAARKLGRAQSAVSYQIAKLEQLLGIELFDRSHRRPQLTAAGQSLLADATRVERDVGQLVARARAMGRGTEPQLSIAVDVLYPLEPLLDALAEFARAFAETPVRLYTEALGAVPMLVTEGVCDLGIGSLYEQRETGRLERQALSAGVELVTVVAPGHPLAAISGALPQAALEQHTQLVLTDRSQLTEGQDYGVLTARSWRLADLGTKHACLKAGFGFGNMPLHLVQEDLGSGALVRIYPASAPTSIMHPLYFLWRQVDPPGPAARWLLERLEPPGAGGR
jgi:DNA-binding transcriptional LysR family regulator